MFFFFQFKVRLQLTLEIRIPLPDLPPSHHRYSPETAAVAES
jgi:hypothetical protein